MSVKISIENIANDTKELEVLDENIEIQVNKADNIYINVDINLITLKVINNKNLKLSLPNNKTILLKDLVVNIFQNEIEEKKISSLNLLFNVKDNMNYCIDSMKALFDAIEFTSSKFNKSDTSSTSIKDEKEGILFNEEDFIKYKDNLDKNTKNNDLIFYDELVKKNK